METQNYEEPDVAINIIDLMKSVARHYRPMIIVGIVCAILALIYGAITTQIGLSNEARNAEVAGREKNAAAARELLMDSVTDPDKAQRTVNEVENAFSSYQLLLDKQEYRTEYAEKSIRMNLDPMSVPNLTVQYYLSGNKNVRNIITSIAGFGLSDADCKKAAAVLGLSEEDYGYVRELIGISDLTDSSYYQLYSGNVENADSSLESDTSAVMFLKVTGKDQASSEALMGILQDAVMENAEKMKSVYGEFEIRKLGSGYNEIIDGKLKDEQQALKEELADYQSTVIRYEDNVKTDGQKDYFRALADLENAKRITEEVEEGELPLFRRIRRYISFRTIIISGILGAFLIAAYYGMLYLFDGKIKTCDEVTSTYGISTIRNYPVAVERRRGFFGFLDHWIDSWGKPKDMAGSDQIDQLAVTELNAIIEKKELKNVLVICEPKEGRALETAERISKDISVDVTVTGSSLTDSTAVTELAKSDAVLFVVLEKAAKRKAMNKDVELCVKFGSKVIGAIGVD